MLIYFSSAAFISHHTALSFTEIMETTDYPDLSFESDIDNANDDQINDNSGISPLIKLMYQSHITKNFIIIYNASGTVWQPPKFS
jgi:hypothetical protein